MELIILILAVSYLALLVLFGIFGHLIYKKRIRDLNTNRKIIYQYYCPNCTRFFKVRYYIEEVEPLNSVECPFCRNNVAAFIIDLNDSPHRN
jgi:hypothetical protein